MIEKVSPQAHFTNGNIGIGIVLDGTWKSPNLHGAISIKHLKGKVDLLPETFYEMNGEIRINGSKLEIINFDSKYGKGRAAVSGGLSLRGLFPDQLDLAIHIDRFHYKGPGFESMINSDFKITGTISEPLISGEAVINKSTISIVRSKRLKRFEPRLDILVHSGKENYFRQVGLANVLVRGDLHIGGTLTYPELLGKVSSNRGTLTLYGTTFRLVEATSEFDPKNGLFPYISGQAKTRKESVEITLTARGWTNQTLEMHLESRPAMSYEEIVSLLHWTDREGGLALLQGNVNSIVDSLVGSRLNQFGNTIGLDFFDIEQEQFSGPFRLNLGKSITKDLYLGYSRTLDPLGEDYWVLEYSLSPNISLLGEYTEEDGTTLQLDFHFRF
jgi:translocation and assembly module TamB